MATTACCAITGPDTYDRSDPVPPSFQILSPENRYYAIEIATEATLFDETTNGARRTESNFFATWQQGLIEMPLTGITIYYIPSHVWRLMRQSEAIYYRILTSASQDMWSAVQSSLKKQDIAHAPKILLKGRFTHMANNPYPPEEDLWRRSAEV